MHGLTLFIDFAPITEAILPKGLVNMPSNRSGIGGAPEPTETTPPAGREPAFHSQDKGITKLRSSPQSGGPPRVPGKPRDSSNFNRRASLSRSESSPCDSFFATEPPPPNVATAGLKVRHFLKPLQEEEGLLNARVAIVTSGGTDVPLEVMLRQSLLLIPCCLPLARFLSAASFTPATALIWYESSSS